MRPAMRPTTAFSTEMKERTFCCKYDSTLGEILIAAEGDALTGLWFAGQKYFAAGLGESVPATPEDCAPLRQAVCWLREYFSGKEPELRLCLAPKGTAFQKRVWAVLGEIPYGETMSYARIAERIGCKSPRAVGAAVGRNPIYVLIPCHRVIGSGGGLTGYAGGLDRKRFLLDLESPKGLIDK